MGAAQQQLRLVHRPQRLRLKLLLLLLLDQRSAR